MKQAALNYTGKKGQYFDGHSFYSAMAKRRSRIVSLVAFGVT